MRPPTRSGPSRREESGGEGMEEIMASIEQQPELSSQPDFEELEAEQAMDADRSRSSSSATSAA